MQSRERPAFLILPGMHVFSFSVIIPVKSFVQILNSKSLHLNRQKSGGGETGLKYSSNNYVLKYSI